MSERIGWAKARNTTEEEDQVYCLLGILGLSMPTSYGEGKEKAWARLYTEIETADNAPCIIPFIRNDRFAGRESQLAELEAKLFKEEQTTTIAVVGPPGTGKSQLALELAYRTRQKNKSCSIFWVDASDSDGVYQSYVSIAQKLNVAGWDEKNANIIQLVKLHLSSEIAGQWLAVFDNVDGVSSEPGHTSTAGAAGLLSHLPQSKLGTALFTSTNAALAKNLALYMLELEELTQGLAQKILGNHLAVPLARREKQEAELLLKELSYLPLAISRAAAHINTRNITLPNYRAKFIKTKKKALRGKQELLRGRQQKYGVSFAVSITLMISVDQIRRENPTAIDFLFLAACLNQKDIPLDVLEASASRKREDAIRLLSDYALVTRRPADSAIDVHQLIHYALRQQLRDRNALESWTQRAITRLLRVFPSIYHSNRSKWRRLLPHTKYILLNRLQNNKSANRISLALECASALRSNG